MTLVQSGGGRTDHDGHNIAAWSLTSDDLAFAAQVRAEALRSKAYRLSFVGQEAGRYLRALRWSGHPQNTLDTYEIVLARISVDFAHLTSLEEFTTDLLRDFLEEHWGEAAASTRQNRLAIVRSFFTWAVDERGLPANPAAPIKPVRVRNRERNAYKPDVIHRLIVAQPTLRDQIAVQLLGRLALRKNELRLIRLGDFDLVRGTVLVHGKGGKQVVLPLGFAQLKSDLEVYLIDRAPAEYLLYPRARAHDPMDPASVHRWFKGCLRRAGLPGTVQIHELRHSAADNLWRQTGNLLLAQQLLRHESVATTQTYLHPNRDDLDAALRSLEKVVRSDDGEGAQ